LILDVAKEVIPENGFARAPMDMIAARAQTSQRPLYARFPAKDVLCAAVPGRSRALLRAKLRPPGSHAETPAEAATPSCAPSPHLPQWTWLAHTCRLGISEAERTPEVSAQLYEAFFGTAGEYLASFLGARYGLADAEAKALADRLLGAVVYPALPQILFGVRRPNTELPDRERLADDVDLDAVRRDVTAVLTTVKDGTA